MTFYVLLIIFLLSNISNIQSNLCEEKENNNQDKFFSDFNKENISYENQAVQTCFEEEKDEKLLNRPSYSIFSCILHAFCSLFHWLFTVFCTILKDCNLTVIFCVALILFIGIILMIKKFSIEAKTSTESFRVINDNNREDNTSDGGRIEEKSEFTVMEENKIYNENFDLSNAAAKSEKSDKDLILEESEFSSMEEYRAQEEISDKSLSIDDESRIEIEQKFLEEKSIEMITDEDEWEKLAEAEQILRASVEHLKLKDEFKDEKINKASIKEFMKFKIRFASETKCSAKHAVSDEKVKRKFPNEDDIADWLEEFRIGPRRKKSPNTAHLHSIIERSALAQKVARSLTNISNTENYT
ncbi:repetitive organellar protein-like [Centruroides vittatus]|uniref:repetitive organellar protein-like n=1 Tax=Centruroides vittatus TaxID=120091 RepID=UPI00351064A3